ncbi:MAG: hypothetical protein KGP29_02245 [Proteobacteria bacterium]|nr:hypothetical protein [Pseudomonadota bacterium]
MKNLIAIFTLISLTACSNWASDEVKASAKAGAASSRLNASDNNSKDAFKELDE